MVQLLQKAGAIPLCTSNTIQIMMLSESYNRIWGRSKNPWDLSRTPGGSTGGDAALVAMGCVPLALASDVAGSIRIPACFTGIVGFKPTSTRMSMKGCMKPRKVSGQKCAVPCVLVVFLALLTDGLTGWLRLQTPYRTINKAQPLRYLPQSVLWPERWMIVFSL